MEPDEVSEAGRRAAEAPIPPVTAPVEIPVAPPVVQQHQSPLLRIRWCTHRLSLCSRPLHLR